MKVLVDAKDEGMQALIGEVVTLLCANYFYTGKLVGVNDNCVKLENASIVYETGEWSKKDWANAEKLPGKSLYVSMSAIEAFGVLK